MTFIADVKNISSTESIVAQRTLVDLLLTNFVIPSNTIDEHKYVDFNWRDFKVSEPVQLIYSVPLTGMNKTIGVNYMSDTLESLMPGFIAAIRKAGGMTETINLLSKPVIDYEKLSTPMDKWYVLFDPAASLQETEGYGFKGEENAARVVTIYSLGEGSIREGKHEDTTFESSFGSGNNRYSLEFTIPAPNARIDVLGYSKMTTSGSDEIAIISKQNEGGSSYAGSFPVVVLGSFGAIMAVVIGIVLFKTRKEHLEI
jgi:hypothetical protein